MTSMHATLDKLEVNESLSKEEVEIEVSGFILRPSLRKTASLRRYLPGMAGHETPLLPQKSAALRLSERTSSYEPVGTVTVTWQNEVACILEVHKI